MGFAVAEAARDAGHEVLLVAGPTQLVPPHGVDVVRVTSALEMAAAVDAALPDASIVFGVAAVADARPKTRWPGKPPKGAQGETLALIPNPDIIAGVGARKGDRVVVGFALEAPAVDSRADDALEAALARGQAKLAAKQLDAIVVNTASALAADRSEVVLLRADGGRRRLPPQDKRATAIELVQLAEELWRSKQ